MYDDDDDDDNEGEVEDVDEDEEEDDDHDDEEEGEERKMMKWALRRRRKMMRWRERMLRRKTDPKTGKHTLWEPAQSKCTWTFDKSHCVCVKIYRKKGTPIPDTAFCACAVETHMDIWEEPFCVEI